MASGIDPPKLSLIGSTLARPGLFPSRNANHLNMRWAMCVASRMKLTTITQLVAVGVGAVIALGTVTSCSKSGETPATSTTTASSAAAMPQSGTFIAKLPAKEGQPQMVLAVTVEGDHVAAYACNNSNDEAWFFGTQKDGSMKLTSKYQDTLQASFDGEHLNTTLTMNDVTYTGSAEAAAAPAGIYTATAGGARAAWIMMVGNSVVGVTSPNSRNDRELIDKINAEQQGFKDKVRQARLQRQLEQAAALNTSNFTSTLNGTTVTAVQVRGNMTSPPS
jgi:hypothetical protein